MFSAMVSGFKQYKGALRYGYDRRNYSQRKRAAYRGLKEKALAAYRAGVKRVIIPSGNAEDISDIPQEIVGEMQFIPVDDINQVLENALVKMPVKRERAGGKAVKDGN